MLSPTASIGAVTTIRGPAMTTRTPTPTSSKAFWPNPQPSARSVARRVRATSAQQADHARHHGRQGRCAGLAWLAIAALTHWNTSSRMDLVTIQNDLHSGSNARVERGYRGLLTLVHQGRHHLRMRTAGALSVPVEGGKVHQYYEALRGIIEAASTELFFVDQF